MSNAFDHKADPGSGERHRVAEIREQLARVAERSTLYRERFRDVGFDPSAVTSLRDLEVLPLTTKQDHVAALQASPPWGDHLACDLQDVRRVHFSSGTTSEPTPVCWTEQDLDEWMRAYAAGARSFGVTDRDVYQCLFSYAWFVGGLGTHGAFERIGATAIPGGSAEARRQIETIIRFGSTFVAGTPSFILYLSEIARDMGIDLRESAVQRILLGGEVGGAVPATRSLLEERWGARCFDGYGSLEFQPIAWECSEQQGGHLFEDVFHAEVLDPETHEPVPDGTPGLLVLTHLHKQAHPFVRWSTGDIVVRDGAPCDCGLAMPRLPGGVRGRADSMLVIRGVNLYPSAIEEVVRAVPGTSGEYQVVATDDLREPTTGRLERIGLRVEASGSVPPEVLRDEIAQAVKEQLRVRAEVQVTQPGELPRTTHKASRYVR